MRTFLSSPWILPTLSAFALLTLAGCAASPSGQRTIAITHAASAAAGAGEPIVFRTVGGPLDDPADVSDGLTLADAARLALKSSPEIGAALARVRAAEAEVDQAGLLPNPILSIVFRFPSGGGKPQIEAGLAADLLAVLSRPQRTSVAQSRLGAAGGQAVGTVLNVVADVHNQYAAVQSLDAMLPLLEQRRRLVARLLEIAQSRLDLGEGTQLEVAVAAAQRTELEVEIAEKSLERRQARLTLAKQIGTPSAKAEWTLSPWESPARLLAAEPVWVQAALAGRSEIQALQHELAAREAEAGMTGLQLFGPGELGIEAERDPGWAAGPAISIAAPIFDVGQARRAKARALVIESRHELTAIRREVVEQVRNAYEAATASAEMLGRVRDELVPLQQKRREQAEAAYQAGQTDITAVMLADQELGAARTRLIELEHRASRAANALQRAVGGAAAARSVQP